MKPGDKVVIGFSGSDNSNTLLHLIKSGLQESSHKKLMFLPSIVYIDETAILNLTQEESEAISSEINKKLKQYNFAAYRVPLAMSIQSEDSLAECLADGEYTVEDGPLKELFHGLRSASAKIDLLNKLRYNLLVQTAKYLGCGKLFTAESADDLAVTLLTNVALGRGTQLPYDVGCSDDRVPGVKVIRPLRDISKKELAFYNIFHSISSVHIPALSTKMNPHSSIQKLTETFLFELQNEFPSTLSTVFRVADKLTSPSSDQNTCPLCMTQKDSEEAATSSKKATEFSSMIACLGPTNFSTDTLAQNSSDSDCLGSCNNRCSSLKGGSCSSKSLAEESQETLCYGCHLIFKDADLKTLPSKFLRSLCDSSQRMKMKAEIEEFLL